MSMPNRGHDCGRYAVDQIDKYMSRDDIGAQSRPRLRPVCGRSDRQVHVSRRYRVRTETVFEASATKSGQKSTFSQWPHRALAALRQP
jgi:hypothetical protein